MGLIVLTTAVTFAAQIQIYPVVGGVATPLSGRITITNRGPNIIHVGPTGVTAANGFPIAASGGTKELLAGANPNSAIFAIAETAIQVTPLDTRVLVETKD